MSKMADVSVHRLCQSKNITNPTPSFSNQASDKKTKRATRAATASGSQTDIADSPKPLTSGDLKYRPMRVWQRRQRVNEVVREQLKETAFVFLDDEKKSLLLAAIDKCLTDDM